MVTGYSLGYKCEYVNNQWVYSDTKESIINNPRPCPYCGKNITKERYDACLGELPNVQSACCGHGVEKPWVMFNDGLYKKFDNVQGLKDYFNKKCKVNSERR